MHGNAKMMKLLGIEDQQLSEEEIYDAWYSRIVPEDLDSVQKAVEEMLEGKLSESTYRWTHPTRGELYVRSGGTAKLPSLISSCSGDITAM